MVSIRLILPHEWHLHRDVRLQALFDSPHAFGSSYEAEAKRSNYEWQQVIETALASGKNHVYLAESDGVVCGLVWCKLSARETGLAEPPRVSRRPNFLREYPNEKYLLT